MPTTLWPLLPVVVCRIRHPLAGRFALSSNIEPVAPSTGSKLHHLMMLSDVISPNSLLVPFQGFAPSPSTAQVAEDHQVQWHSRNHSSQQRQCRLHVRRQARSVAQEKLYAPEILGVSVL